MPGLGQCHREWVRSWGGPAAAAAAAAYNPTAILLLQAPRRTCRPSVRPCLPVRVRVMGFGMGQQGMSIQSTQW